MTALGSRNRSGHPKNDEFYTPKFIFDALDLTFDMDVASPAENTTNVPARRKLTPVEDGLSVEWQGLVWMNPPFSKCEPWVTKWLDHGNGIALLPTSKAKWFGELWLRCDAMLLLPSRFKFDRPDDQRADIFMPTMLVSMGEMATESLHHSHLGKVRQ
jgi:hypothetical protein